jgi:hypothetical protein
MQFGHPDTQRLAGLLAKLSLTEDDLQHTADLLETLGGKSATEQIAHDHLQRALATLDSLTLPRPSTTTSPTSSTSPSPAPSARNDTARLTPNPCPCQVPQQRGHPHG